MEVDWSAGPDEEKEDLPIPKVQAVLLTSETIGIPKRYRYADETRLWSGTDFLKFMRLVN